MILVTLLHQGVEQAGIRTPHGVVLLADINRAKATNWSLTVFELLQDGELDFLAEWWRSLTPAKIAALPAVREEQLALAPLYRHPSKIWGIGFNYVKDLSLLEETRDDFEPVGFMKPDTTLIGHGGSIVIPRQSERTVAEAELAIVIGRACRDVSAKEAMGCVAGFASALDMSADDIHARNPRLLTRAKSFDTFFSFGSELATADEFGDLADLTVTTVHNGAVAHSNTLRHMIVPPAEAIAYLSEAMTLLPGDIILTGTPGNVVVRDGDVMEARIDGFLPLVNPVRG